MASLAQCPQNIPAGVGGSIPHIRQNGDASANPRGNPQGQAPLSGSSSGRDGDGGNTQGGQDPGPCSERSGIAGSGRGDATNCMFSDELNACRGDNPGNGLGCGIDDAGAASTTIGSTCSTCSAPSAGGGMGAMVWKKKGHPAAGGAIGGGIGSRI